MKFGKYLAKRQLDLPEYAGHLIDYKALKKLIKSLAAPNPEALATLSQHEIQRRLQDNKFAFFFRLDRELEKVNDCYELKERELRVRLNILVDKKQNWYQAGELSSKTSVAYISLHEGFLRFRRDLDRLEQFIELSATGFSKALKKWDKRSKSQTKEMYLSRAVEVQPVFHREELAELSDVANSSILEIEAWAEGDTVIFESQAMRSNSIAASSTTSGGSISAPSTGTIPPMAPPVPVSHNVNSTLDRDDLYNEFIKTITEDVKDEEMVKKVVDEWVNQLVQTDAGRGRITRIFLLMISTEAPDVAFFALHRTGLVDMKAVDEISGKNCLHRAASAGRKAVIDLAIKSKVDIDLQDTHGRTPLHYACLGNHHELIELLVTNGADIDAQDKENYSPLLYSIVNHYETCVSELLRLGSSVEVDSERDYIPLNLACQYGVYSAVKALLEKSPIMPDAEGLYPIHVVARAGHADLVPLLKPYVNINELDKFNGWTALCYAASEGHVETVKALIAADADVNALDEDGLTALYHASWQGHATCVSALASTISSMLNVAVSEIIDKSVVQPKFGGDSSVVPSSQNGSSMALDVQTSSLGDLNDLDAMDIDAIPDLSLPPPIIPLKRYGHNFLDKRTIIQFFFDTSASPIRFHRSGNQIPAGRLTISTHNNTDQIPQSIILPLSDTDRSVVSFQVESLDDFGVDFEIFPTFGTQITAKTAALPYVFSPRPHALKDYVCELPLFDMRMKAVGEIAFRFQIIKPFQGKALEITKYDTYWKSTSQLEQQQKPQSQMQSLSFVTASSLSGDYCRLFVCLTRDGVPVVTTTHSWDLTVTNASGQEVSVPIGDVDLATFLALSGQNEQKLDAAYQRLRAINSTREFAQLISTTRLLMPLDGFLRYLPLDLKLDIGVLYPTPTDASFKNLGTSTFPELNEYVDTVLAVLFDHARQVRRDSDANNPAGTPSGNSNRGIIFSSSNPDVCTVLNWKQPNYPVFFQMKGLRHNFESGLFEYQSANGFPAKDRDARCVSVKEAANFAAKNNLLGIILPASLLKMVPHLVESVKVLGLVLVSTSDRQVEPGVRLNGVDGFRNSSVLTFQESIDV